MKIWKLSLILAWLFLPGLATAETTSTLSLADYLAEVRAKNGDYHAATDSAIAAHLKSRESELVLAPTLFSDAQYTDDQKPGSLYTYSSLKTTQLDLGLSQQTDIGLRGRLYYTINEQEYDNLNFAGLNINKVSVIQTSPAVDLTMPLWRNWLGSETNGTIEQGTAQSEAAKETQRFQMKTLAAQAEQAYWNLALARENLRVSRDSVQRNSELLAWHRKRVSHGLADKADLLQAEAALQTSTIAQKSADDAEMTAARAFNLARGIDAPRVSESLVPLTATMVAKLTPPKRQAMREDVKAVQAQMQAAAAAATLSKEKYKPTFELFGTAALNNPNPRDQSTAFSGSFTSSNPTRLVGLRLSAPLSGGIIHDVNLGAERDKIAAQETYERKLVEQDEDWHSLNERFTQAQERYRLYSDLVVKQQQKLDYERSRRSSGRTTTEQVLLFENDLESAQLNQLQALVDLFNTYAQMKLYEEAAL